MSRTRIVPDKNRFVLTLLDIAGVYVYSHCRRRKDLLLAKVRYNRLIDVFLRVTAYSLQSHLRTTVPDVGQIETDELYVAVRNTGQQFIVPVQAKVGRD